MSTSKYKTLRKSIIQRTKDEKLLISMRNWVPEHIEHIEHPKK